MKPIFVDTGAWIAIAVARDEMHQPAAAYAAQLAQRSVPLLTTNYVLSETYTRIRYDDGHARALAFDAIIREMTRKRLLTVRCAAHIRPARQSGAKGPCHSERRSSSTAARPLERERFLALLALGF